MTSKDSRSRKQKEINKLTVPEPYLTFLNIPQSER